MDYLYLVNNSSYFPALVEAACRREGVEYTVDVLWHAAKQDYVTAAIVVDLDQRVDEVLESLLAGDADTGAAVDSAIIAAVSSYPGMVV